MKGRLHTRSSSTPRTDGRISSPRMTTLNRASRMRITARMKRKAPMTFVAIRSDTARSSASDSASASSSYSKFSASGERGTCGSS